MTQKQSMVPEDSGVRNLPQECQEYRGVPTRSDNEWRQAAVLWILNNNPNTEVSEALEDLGVYASSGLVCYCQHIGYNLGIQSVQTVVKHGEVVHCE